MGNHALCGDDNFPRTSGAKCSGKLGTTARFKHGDCVLDADAFDEPKASRSHVHGALRVVTRIGLVSAAQSQLPRQLHGSFTVGELMGHPSPIAL